MSGETSENVSAWTIDSLRAHLTDLVAEVDRRYDERFDSQQRALNAALVSQTQANAATKDTLDTALNSLNKLLGEMDLRYQQRYDQSQEAITHALNTQQATQSQALQQMKEGAAVAATANITLREHFGVQLQEMDRRIGSDLSSLEKASLARFDAMRDTNQAALLAQREAVAKVEAANEKRFESVNNFRGQLADQASRLMPRTEVDTVVSGLQDRVSAVQERVNEVNTRIDKSEGRSTGVGASWGVMATIIGFLLTIMAIGIAIFSATH